jgi:hypothetical protein
MTEAVFQFKAIRQKLERQEQKAEFDAKEAKTVQSMYGWPYGVAVPYRQFVGEYNGVPILDRREDLN